MQFQTTTLQVLWYRMPDSLTLFKNRIQIAASRLHLKESVICVEVLNLIFVGGTYCKSRVHDCNIPT
jgi:hypothetical protein